MALEGEAECPRDLRREDPGGQLPARLQAGRRPAEVPWRARFGLERMRTTRTPPASASIPAGARRLRPSGWRGDPAGPGAPVWCLEASRARSRQIHPDEAELGRGRSEPSPAAGGELRATHPAAIVQVQTRETTRSGVHRRLLSRPLREPPGQASCGPCTLETGPVASGNPRGRLRISAGSAGGARCSFGSGSVFSTPARGGSPGAASPSTSSRRPSSCWSCCSSAARRRSPRPPSATGYGRRRSSRSRA